MAGHIGISGRLARDLASGRARKRATHPSTGWLHSPARSGPLPLVQRDRSSSPAGADTTEGQSASSPVADQEPTAIERETRSPSPEEVARRVYELFREDARRGRERERPLV